MMKKLLFVLWWILAILLAAVIAIYQRFTGPTNPIRAKINFLNSQVKYRLLRSYTAFEKLPVKIVAPNTKIKAFCVYRRFKSKDKWTKTQMHRNGIILFTEIPGQPKAGKIEYKIKLLSTRSPS